MMTQQTTVGSYRVMVRMACGGAALVAVARSRAEAVTIAGRFQQAALRAEPNPALRGPVTLQVWRGGTLDGRWRELPAAEGGVSLPLPARRSGRGRKSKDREATGGRLRSGERVKAVLQKKRTRKGGWLARVATGQLVGPITNSSEMPGSAEPGQVVELRIGAVRDDGSRIQFHWPAG